MRDLTPVFFALCGIGVFWSFYQAHKRPDVDFNFLDLLMENGKVSKISCLVMGSFGLHSWIMLDLETHGRMTEGYLTIYGATWISPLLLRLFNAPQVKNENEPKRD